MKDFWKRILVCSLHQQVLEFFKLLQASIMLLLLKTFRLNGKHRLMVKILFTMKPGRLSH